MRNLSLLLLLLLLSSCYNRTQEAGLYEVNDNFVVTADTMHLQMQQPMHNMPMASSVFPDSIFMLRGEELVIAQTAVIPEDSVDSVWVKVARDQQLMGWIHEQDLLSSVVPNEPFYLSLQPAPPAFLCVPYRAGIGTPAGTPCASCPQPCLPAQ